MKEGQHTSLAPKLIHVRNPIGGLTWNRALRGGENASLLAASPLYPCDLFATIRGLHESKERPEETLFVVVAGPAFYQRLVHSGAE